MEKIKQAIEKARKQQPPDSNQVRPLPKSDSDEVSFNYSQTRIEHLDKMHLETNRIVAFNKNDPLTISFDILRTQVLGRMEDKGWKTIAIVSPTPECGKTVMAINLAMSIAHHSSKTAMLVDFDLRRPKVANYLGISVEKSLNEFISGEADLSEILINPELPKFVVIPTIRPVPKSSEVLSSKKIELLVNDLRERYNERIVLFDFPPLLNTDDAITVLPQIDCALLVVGNGMVTNSELQESLRLLDGINLIGVVLNKADSEVRNYYY